MLRLIVLSTTATFTAFLFFAIPAQADDLAPEPHPAAEPASAPDPEPDPDPHPDPALSPASHSPRHRSYAPPNMAGPSSCELPAALRGPPAPLAYSLSPPPTLLPHHSRH